MSSPDWRLPSITERKHIHRVESSAASVVARCFFSGSLRLRPLLFLFCGAQMRCGGDNYRWSHSICRPYATVGCWKITIIIAKWRVHRAFDCHKYAILLPPPQPPPPIGRRTILFVMQECQWAHRTHQFWDHNITFNRYGHAAHTAIDTPRARRSAASSRGADCRLTNVQPNNKW